MPESEEGNEQVVSITPVEEVQQPPLETTTGLPQRVEFSTWSHARFGVKHLDQAAAFARWCKRGGVGMLVPRSTAQWNALHHEFSTTPAGA